MITCSVSLPSKSCARLWHACRIPPTIPARSSRRRLHRRSPHHQNLSGSGRPWFALIQPVGTFPPNAFGLYDMHGNVYQWCQDWFRENTPRGKDSEVLAGATAGSSAAGVGRMPTCTVALHTAVVATLTPRMTTSASVWLPRSGPPSSSRRLQPAALRFGVLSN